ncbi:MAG: glutamate---cysteine ligase / carboxylate-amine ligase [Thermoleophilaceae bacterium]|nr:glutamate---cysteine ligase / carboxylate-amine ligase [Thermoleophilaceae bacterium]
MIDWARWRASDPYTVGMEEEVMLLQPDDWALAHDADRVMSALSPELEAHATCETHGSAIELNTGVHGRVGDAAAEARALRRALDSELRPLGRRAASAGTHPFAVWQDTVVSSGARYQAVYGSMRVLARREPTVALHVHVGIPDAECGIRVVNAMRGHLPLFLALSVNSPFWQGRDTGLASARTPLFQAFPRVGIPRAFHDYSDWVETVELLIRCAAFPEPTFLWWDVRPQPRFGTVEVRILDAQTTVADSAALCALVQCTARLEAEERRTPSAWGPEVLGENRFLAARDGMDARLIDERTERRVPAAELLDELLRDCAPHARALGCEAELAHVRTLATTTGARRQINASRNEGRLPELVRSLADAFTGRRPPGGDGADVAPAATPAGAPAPPVPR